MEYLRCSSTTWNCSWDCFRCALRLLTLCCVGLTQKDGSHDDCFHSDVHFKLNETPHDVQAAKLPDTEWEWKTAVKTSRSPKTTRCQCPGHWHVAFISLEMYKLYSLEFVLFCTVYKTWKIKPSILKRMILVLSNCILRVKRDNWTLNSQAWLSVWANCVTEAWEQK